jgi:hypothetical protein
MYMRGYERGHENEEAPMFSITDDRRDQRISPSRSGIGCD